MNLFGFSQFEKILARLDEEVQVYSRRCVRRFDKDSSCNKCVDICPTGVLSKDSSRSNKNCVKCGLCATVCPTEVFELKRNTEQFLLSKIKYFLEYTSDLTFICDKNTNFGEKKAVKVPCLGRLNESILVGAASLGATAVWLDESFCSECEIEKGNRVAQNIVESSQEILSAFRSPTEILLAAEPSESIKKQTFNGLPEDQYSRRDLFAHFRKTALQAGVTLIESSLPFLPLEEKKKSQKPYKLPPKRLLLLSFLSRFGRPVKKEIPAENLPFYQIKIEDSCTLCGQCVKLCPTRAMVYAYNGRRGSIDFTLSFCTACELCKDVCSPGALTFREHVYAPLLGMYRRGRYQRKRLFTYSLIKYRFYRCKECQRKFGSLTPSELCLSCQNNSQTDTSVNNSADSKAQ